MRFSGEEKAMWLDDWRKSGKSAWAYAKENGLNTQTFVKWAKTGTENPACFVEVVMPKAQTADSNQEILVEKGDVRIHIPLAFGHELLSMMAEKMACRI